MTRLMFYLKSFYFFILFFNLIKIICTKILTETHMQRFLKIGFVFLKTITTQTITTRLYFRRKK